MDKGNAASNVKSKCKNLEGKRYCFHGLKAGHTGRDCHTEIKCFKC